MLREPYCHKNSLCSSSNLSIILNLNVHIRNFTIDILFNLDSSSKLAILVCLRLCFSSKQVNEYHQNFCLHGLKLFVCFSVSQDQYHVFSIYYSGNIVLFVYHQNYGFWISFRIAGVCDSVGQSCEYWPHWNQLTKIWIDRSDFYSLLHCDLRYLPKQCP